MKRVLLLLSMAFFTACQSAGSKAQAVPPEWLLQQEEKDIREGIASWIMNGWNNERIMRHLRQRAREIGSPPNATPNTSSIFHYRLDDHFAVWVRYAHDKKPDYDVYRCEGWLTTAIGGEIQAVLSNGVWYEVTIWGIGNPIPQQRPD